MRTTFYFRNPTTTSTTTAAVPGSPWRSPVPYMFGGMAAMLGLIAFAFVILACSDCLLSGNDNVEEDGRQLEVKSKGVVGDHQENNNKKVVVIMAGDDKPSFLATPSALIFSNPIINSLDDLFKNKSSTVSMHEPNESDSNALDVTPTLSIIRLS
ncbi:hypothetical protein Cgig2_009913 [Carnegiea gigantea]|uniref:Uncharacterized protein n=1 Tax=Carnegiea gigantea TaxID=171969 RepID=A0A9Q1QBQ0_9CARY|nr:hypothetical protein Cgig2_009913 [Carnegiea gigantea]